MSFLPWRKSPVGVPLQQQQISGADGGACGGAVEEDGDGEFALLDAEIDQGEAESVGPVKEW